MSLPEHAARLRSQKRVAGDELATRLVDVLVSETGISSAGYPVLGEAAYGHFRDTVPHILRMGSRVLTCLGWLAPLAREGAEPELLAHVDRAEKVIVTMVRTAAITAPPDLWLLRHVLGAFAEVGLSGRLLAGEAIDPSDDPLEKSELGADLAFLHARGYVTAAGDGYRLTPGDRVRRVFEALGPVPSVEHEGTPALWAALLSGESLTPQEAEILGALAAPTGVRDHLDQSTWTATLEEIQLGYRLVPVMLGLHLAGLTGALQGGEPIGLQGPSGPHAHLVRAALELLVQAGALQGDGDGALTASPLGRRLAARAVGPFGVIETYHPYMMRLASLLREGRTSAWVHRAANITASQDANRHTFRACNDALDAFCRDTGFRYDVFLEHAMGRGEAIRQRFDRSPAEGIRFFGADLEDAAIEAAGQEKAAGRLPGDLELISQADVGDPERVISRVRASGCATEGAVMMVGNGFHEVRQQTDDKMVDIFRRYHDAGIVLLFTEANALRVEDLLATAWNTYHAGFMYVHRKSGQGLRPADPIPAGVDRSALPSSWTTCATGAGYVRMVDYESRARTVYPHPRADGYNPTISANHFLIPRPLALRLGLAAE